MSRLRLNVRTLMVATALVALCLAIFGVLLGSIISAVVLLRYPLGLRKPSLVTLSLVLVSVLLVLSSNKAVWVGHMNVAIRFSVVERCSGQPIQGAVIEFFEVDCPPEWKVTPLRSLVTDGHGVAILTE